DEHENVPELPNAPLPRRVEIGVDHPREPRGSQDAKSRKQSGSGGKNSGMRSLGGRLHEPETLSPRRRALPGSAAKGRPKRRSPESRAAKPRLSGVYAPGMIRT